MVAAFWHDPKPPPEHPVQSTFSTVELVRTPKCVVIENVAGGGTGPFRFFPLFLLLFPLYWLFLLLLALFPLFSEPPFACSSST